MSSGGGACEVQRYDLRTGKRIQVPNPSGLRQYSASVTRNGILCFAQKDSRPCGANVRLLRYRLGSPPQLLARLPTNYDVPSTAATSDEPRTLYFEIRRCDESSDGGSDIYEIMESLTRPG